MLYWKIHNDLKLLATFNEISCFAFIHSSMSFSIQIGKGWNSLARKSSLNAEFMYSSYPKPNLIIVRTFFGFFFIFSLTMFLSFMMRKLDFSWYQIAIYSANTEWRKKNKVLLEDLNVHNVFQRQKGANLNKPKPHNICCMHSWF